MFKELGRKAIMREEFLNYRKMFNNYDDAIRSPIILKIIMSNRIGAIAIHLAKQLNIDNVKALKLFYESKTCADLHDKSTGLYLYGDLYIADEFIREMENKQ